MESSGPPRDIPDESPKGILLERRQGTQPLPDIPPDEGGRRHPFRLGLASEGGVEILLDHGLEPFHAFQCYLSSSD
jgi:hypothetical protein